MFDSQSVFVRLQIAIVRSYQGIVDGFYSKCQIKWHGLQSSSWDWESAYHGTLPNRWQGPESKPGTEKGLNDSGVPLEIKLCVAVFGVTTGVCLHFSLTPTAWGRGAVRLCCTLCNVFLRLPNSHASFLPKQKPQVPYMHTLSKGRNNWQGSKILHTRIYNPKCLPFSEIYSSLPPRVYKIREKNPMRQATLSCLHDSLNVQTLYLQLQC